MKKVSQLVQYDFQRNTFYKINKQTGQQSLTYKTGEKIKSFRPNITGQNYILRRKHQKIDHTDKGSTIFKEKSVNQQKKHEGNTFYKVMNHTKRQNKMGETSSILMKQTLYSNHTQSMRNSLQKSRKNSITLNARDQDSVLSKQKSNENLKKEELNKTLRSYEKLLKEKSKEAKSPRKDIPGNEKSHDPMETLCTTLNNFRKKQYLLDLKTYERKSHTIVLGQQYSPKNKYLFDRNLFLKCNPEYQPKEDPKKIEIQIQRKKNVRILQDLFIRQGNRKTRSIYSLYK